MLADSSDNADGLYRSMFVRWTSTMNLPPERCTETSQMFRGCQCGSEEQLWLANGSEQLPVWLAKCEQLPDAPGELSPLCGSQNASSCQTLLGSCPLCVARKMRAVARRSWGVVPSFFCVHNIKLEQKNTPQNKSEQIKCGDFWSTSAVG